jgi:hypothetical protein
MLQSHFRPSSHESFVFHSEATKASWPMELAVTESALDGTDACGAKSNGRISEESHSLHTLSLAGL